MSDDVMQHELVERARESGALTKADITKAWFIYWLGAEVSSSYERLQSLIFCASMTPIIKKLYPQKEEQVEALKRHLNFFNSEQTFGAVIQGISIAMEEQKTRGEAINDASITGIKTGLMGPLAGMGDSIIWAAVMPLLIAIFIPFAANGSAMGGILPLILYPAITLAISYGMVHKGYTLGRDSIISLLQGGRIKELIYGANVLGLIMMGALSASFVKITSPLKISALKGSEVVVQQILDSIARAASSFVEIDQLVDKTGELVSRFTGAEDSYVTSCASAGIAIAVAAAITRGDKARVALMPDSSGMANEVVMLRGHNVDYGASILSAIRLGGGRVVEVGSSNLAALWQLESAITDATAALLYVKSHHCVQKGMLNIEDFAHVAQMYNLPLIVDAAAEEDLRAWVVSGADMVVYSGAKAFNAPTSGFITGKKIWIAACKAQHHGIARAMKIGKENMVGLVYALENYHQGQAVITAEQLQPVVEAISAIHGLTADIEQDEAGRAIWRIRIRVNAQELGVDARVVEAQLRGGDIAIYARRYNLHQGVFSLDPRTVAEGEMALIVARLKEIADHAKD